MAASGAGGVFGSIDEPVSARVAPTGPSMASLGDAKRVEMPSWLRMEDLELLNDHFEPAYWDGAKEDDEDGAGIMNFLSGADEDDEDAMLQAALRASRLEAGIDDDATDGDKPTEGDGADAGAGQNADASPSGRIIPFEEGPGA